MREENLKKEILTKERIQADMLVPAHILPEILLLLLAFALLILLGIVIWQYGGWKAFICIPLLGVCEFMLMAVIYKILTDHRRVKRGKFHVVQDTLVDKIQDVKVSPINYREPYRRDLLVFSVHGECFLLYKLYYKWSRLYSMRPREVFDDSNIGDIFYLVILDGDRKKKPVMVYNTKMFELKEE